MQFSAIRTYCATRFRDTANVIVSDADWKNYVNSVYGNVLITMPYAPWNEASGTLVVPASTRSVALPLDGWRVTAVYDQTDAYPMIPIEGRDMIFSEYPTQIEVGQPMHYRIFNNLLEVYPLPQADTTFLVEYAHLPADLVADTDLPVFPEPYHDMLVTGAVGMAYRDDGNDGMASAYEKEYGDMLQSLKFEAGQPRQSRYYQPTDTFM